MSARVATHMTAEEYFAVSTEGDRTQLIDGVMIVDEPLLDHGLAQGVLYGELYHWTGQAPARGYAGVPADVVVSDNDVYAPDVWWLREERVPNRLAGRLAGLPDLAVEIRSPSTWRYVVGTKKSRYEAAGLPELWLVDTQAASVLQFRRTGPEVARFDIELELTAEHELGSPMLPGFALSVERLFRR